MLKTYTVKVTSDKNYPNINYAEHTIEANSQLQALKIMEYKYGSKIKELQLGFEINRTK